MENWLQYKPERFEYRGKWIHNWFSNVAPSPIVLSTGQITDVWPSVENYYQAMKTEDMPTQEAIRMASPAESKRMGRKVHMRPDWDNIKKDVMMRALRVKFSLSPWYEALVGTGDQPIIEWNNWGDRIWGVTEDGVGQNLLGICLMEIREEFKSKLLMREDRIGGGANRNAQILE